VHYYFRTMDDLFLEVFRRRAEQNLARHERALASDRPLRELWRTSVDPQAAAFTVEFAALANHRKAVRGEIARYGERFRSMYLATVARVLAAHGIDEERCPPVVAMLAMTGVSQVLGLESALGITAGHPETLAFVERALDELEGPPRGEPSSADGPDR
jgi:AcrR family transcriptional regulator